MRTSLAIWSSTFFATLGLSSFVGCRTGSPSDTGGAGGTNTGSGRACVNPTPVVGPSGEPSGYVRCGGGWLHREKELTCPSWLPRPTVISDAGTARCRSDADCTDKPHGYCTYAAPSREPFCEYGCRTAADCGTGELCVCGEPVGYCAEATCTTDADCGGKLLCASYDSTPNCMHMMFGCQSPNDACMSMNDCDGGQACSVDMDQRKCAPATCSIGRPFIVAGDVRVAECTPRQDWSQAPTPSLHGMAVAVRELLTEHWSKIAQMEHASIAAFARFSLQLLALGAPADLVEAAQRAQADELRHARLSFGLVSAYAGAPVGPGRLPIDSALGECSALEIARSVMVEGCIFETIGAVEAHEALEHAVDPAVREVLAQVAVDESRHAELAWRSLQWLLSTLELTSRDAIIRELRATVECMLTDSGQDVESVRDAACPALLAHGILTHSLRSEVRRRVLREVIAPCAAALEKGVQVHASARFTASSDSCSRLFR